MRSDSSLAAAALRTMRSTWFAAFSRSVQCAAISASSPSVYGAGTPASVAFTRGLEFTEQNVTAAFELAQKLVRARDLQEAMQLQSEYVRTQFAALQTQAKELTSAVQPNKA